MPCYDDRQDIEGVKTKQRLDLATRVACAALQALEALDYPIALHPELRTWWAEHKKLDASRGEKIK